MDACATQKLSKVGNMDILRDRLTKKYLEMTSEEEIQAKAKAPAAQKKGSAM